MEILLYAVENGSVASLSAKEVRNTALYSVEKWRPISEIYQKLYRLCYLILCLLSDDPKVISNCNFLSPVVCSSNQYSSSRF